MRHSVRESVGPVEAGHGQRLATTWMYVTVPLVVFCAVSFGLWEAYGVRSANDTPFFLTGAKSLRASHLSNPAYVSYLGYLAFVAVFQMLGLGVGAIVFGQWLISGCVLVATYDLGRRLAGPFAGSVAATLYALNVDISRFTFYVLSDSLFASMLLIAVYATSRAATHRGRWRLAAVCACLALASIRTNGWLMAPILAEWLIRSSALPSPGRWAARVALGACCAVFILAGSASIGAGGVTYEFLRTGRVIWLDPESWVAMPPAGTPGPGVSPVVDYVTRHPLASAGLMGRRVFTELTHTRRFYSRSHNAVVALTVWGLYVSAAFGVWAHKSLTITHASVLLIAVQLFIVAITAADWDGRFLIAVLPLVTVWSGIGFSRMRPVLQGAFGRRPRLAGTP